MHLSSPYPALVVLWTTAAITIMTLAVATAFSSIHRTTTPTRRVVVGRPSKTCLSLAASSLYSRSFQLEENEGGGSQITQVILNSDHTIQVGMTDGPIPAIAQGTWMIQEDDGLFAMHLVRTFSATGYGSASGGYGIDDGSSNVGDFSYSLERDFIAGDITQVGECLALSGTAHAITEDDVLGLESELDAKVGYFTMLDVTDITSEERLLEESRMKSYSF